MHTLVLGASTKPERISNQAIHRLRAQNIPVSAIGLKAAKIADVDVQEGTPTFKDLHTITLYLNPSRQQPLYDYILGLEPKRIIFNPGTENPDLITLAKEKGIETEIACTLVLLATNSYDK